MNERIKAVRVHEGLTLEKFGAAIGIAGPSVSLLESGKNNPSEQTIRAIISVFGVSETWLRFGVGEMFPPMPRREAIAAYLGKLNGGKGTEIEELLIEFMAQTSVEEWEQLTQMFKRLAKKINPPSDD